MDWNQLLSVRISSDDVTSLAMTNSFERSFRWKDAVSVLGRRNDSAPSGSLFGVAGGELWRLEKNERKMGKQMEQTSCIRQSTVYYLYIFFWFSKDQNHTIDLTRVRGILQRCCFIRILAQPSGPWTRFSSQSNASMSPGSHQCMRSSQSLAVFWLH